MSRGLRCLRGGLAAAALALLAAAAAQPAGAEGAGERIRAFDVELRVARDGTLRVTERIRYDFGANQRRGIYRDVPVRYGRGSAADYRIALEVTSVMNGAGGAWPYELSRQGSDQRIRIGDPNRRISGEHRYEITYRVRRGILWLPDHDELYWNVTGNAWEVPIDAVRARVAVPEPGAAASGGALRVLCFTGRQGAVEADCTAEADATDARFVAARPLGPGEGLTLVLAIPKGVLDEPSALSRWLDRASDFVNAATALPLLTLLGLGGLWYKLGRDPIGVVAVPVRYEPPQGATPGAMGTLIDEKADLRDVTGTVLDLAIRGYLRIREQESRRFLFLSETDYVFERSSKDASDLLPHETAVLDALFRTGSSVELSDLRNQFYKRLPVIREALYREVSKGRGWFPTSPDAVRTRYTTIVLVAAISLAVLAFLAQQIGTVIAVIVSGAIALAFARHMPRKTRAGRRAAQEVQGFREFIERVEVDRLERIGSRNIEQFERILPFAFVLGAADAWAEAFADLYTEPPSWYVASDGGPFQPGRFIDRVGRSLDTMGNVMTSQPRSSGSGSSGFGGGGFSGGGFGGGGGGSW